MSWQVYLQNLVVMLGAGCFSYSFFLRKKQQYFLELFNTLEKCQKYHLDYVESVEHLPTNKKVIIFGTAYSPTAEQVIARTYLKKSQAQDRLWNYKFKDAFKMQTASKQYVDVQPQDQDSILAFNLPKGPGQDSKHQERVIYHKEPVCAFGLIQKSGENGRKITPEILMGSKHEKIMQYLDGQIVKINNKSRFGIILGSVLIGAHFTYKMIKKRREENGVLAELERQSQGQKK